MVLNNTRRYHNIMTGINDADVCFSRKMRTDHHEAVISRTRVLNHYTRSIVHNGFYHNKSEGPGSISKLLKKRYHINESFYLYIESGTGVNFVLKQTVYRKFLKIHK